ncbi:MAG: transcriptional repressor LexA [Oscillospiraceae bacterium]|jgi:repressor LexA|nr:transcriptional repressor LexA [Oscillospiraceae bacterium]
MRETYLHSESEHLKPTQRRVLAFLQARRRDGVPPTVREIAAGVGLKSTSSVQACLTALEKAGFVTWDKMHKRSLRLTEADEATLPRVPLLGTVTAGVPILAVEQVEDEIPYAGSRRRTSDLFALRVRGDSMKNAGIFGGDIVFVQQTPAADNGDIVVALLGDEATVKRFFVEKDGFRLQPENDAYAPIYCKELVVLGRVVGLTREY